MAKNDTILAVDIGADSLKMAEFSYPPEGGMVLENFAFVEYGGGDLKDDELVNSIAESFHTAIEENDFRSKKVHLSISGQSAFIRFVKLPPVGEDEARVKQLVDYEARQNIPFPMEEVVWDYQLIQRSEEDDGDVEVMFVVIKSDLVESITKIIEDLGKETILVEVAPCSCYNAARANNVGENECVMILNIGGKCSSLVFIDSGRFYVRPIPIAGQTITQQVSKEFGIPFADAEEMKRRHGFVALGGAYEEPDSEVSATVSKIVRNTMTRLHGEINRSINVYRSQQKGKKPLKLYLAGGSSVMAFTPRFFSEKLRIPVEYFNPFQVVSLSERIDRENLAEVAHMFSEVIGLGLRHMTVCPIEISLVPDSVKKQQELKTKIPYFYASAVALILCMGVAWFGIFQQNRGYEKQIEKAEREVTKKELIQNQVRRANSDLGRVQRKYENARKIFDERNTWVDILNEIQKVLPDRMWIISLKATTSPGETTKTESKQPQQGGLFPLFGGPTTTAAAPVSKTREWLEIEGHSLYEKGVTSYIEILKENLKNSELFSDDADDIKTNYFIPISGKDNVTSFKITVKLKKALN